MKILSAKAVAAKTSLSIPFIRRAAKNGALPKPVRISQGRMGWLESDIDDWVSKLSTSKKEEFNDA